MKTIPKPTISTGTDSIRIGALFMYEHDGQPYIGALIGQKKDRNVLLNNRDREVELPRSRLHDLPGQLPAESGERASKVKFLSDLYATVQTTAREFNLEEVWTLIGPEDQTPRSSTELATAYLGKLTLTSHAAFRYALLTDRVFFKRDADFFIPRTVDVIEQLRKTEIARAKKASHNDDLIAYCRACLLEPGTPVPHALQPTFQLLEDVAAQSAHLENQQQREAKEIVNQVCEALNLPGQGSRDSRAMQLLEHIGHITADTNLSLIRYRPPTYFSPEAEKAAADFQFVPGDPTRRDLTHLQSITIDDISTLDMDDAISLERSLVSGNGEGFTLGIHISDVTTAVRPDSILEEEAMWRGTSIYLPDQTIHMLPEVLSADRLSLRAGELRPTLSCLVEFNRNFEMLSHTIVPAVIKVHERLTYDSADQLLDGGDGLLSDIYSITSMIEGLRLAAGAIKTPKIDVIMGPDGAGGVKLTKIDEAAISRTIVSELMVFVNSLFAKYAAEHQIPFVFRGQAAPEPYPPGYTPPPAGPAADFAERGRLKKSMTGLSPLRHASLGLMAYGQVSSPIRRYVDLLNQRQLIAHLATQKPYYTANQLEELLVRLDEPLARAQALSRETRRFWLLRYLDSLRRQQKSIRGVVVRTDLRNPLVELDEVFQTVMIRTDKQVTRGEVVELKILQSDARNDQLKVEVLS